MDEKKLDLIELYYPKFWMHITNCCLGVIGGIIIYNWQYFKDVPYLELALGMIGLVTVIGLLEIEVFKITINETLIIKKSILGKKQFKVSDISSYEIRTTRHQSHTCYHLYLYDTQGKKIIKASDDLVNWHKAHEWAKNHLVNFEQLAAEEEDKKILGKDYNDYRSEYEVDISFLSIVGILSLLIFGLGKGMVKPPYQIFLGSIVYLLIRHHFSRGRLRLFPLNRYSIRAAIGPTIFLMALNFSLQIILLPIELRANILYLFVFSSFFFGVIMFQARKEKKKMLNIILLLITSAIFGHGMALLFHEYLS
jgi:hypothetical protein